MTTSTHEATTVVEYGVRYTWPSGHTETEGPSTLRSAEASVRQTTRRHVDGEIPQTAEVVTRRVTTTAWEVAQ